MKKLCYSAFIAFWSSIATLLAINALATDGNKSAVATEFTLTEVAQHADTDSCWVAIEGNVYDLTAYLPKHPVPPMILAAWCGKDATEVMRTKGYGRDHSPAAWELLKTYRIGGLAQ